MPNKGEAYWKVSSPTVIARVYGNTDASTPNIEFINEEALPVQKIMSADTATEVIIFVKLKLQSLLKKDDLSIDTPTKTADRATPQSLMANR